MQIRWNAEKKKKKQQQENFSNIICVWLYSAYKELEATNVFTFKGLTIAVL